MRSRASLFKVVFAVVLLGLLIFLSGTKVATTLREGVLVAIKPIMKIGIPLRRWFSPTVSLSVTEAEQLRQEQQKLRTEAAEANRLREENQSLREFLRFAESRNLQPRGGLVVHYGMEFGKEFLWVERGKQGGVRVGDLAVDANGFFVGMVREAQEKFSRVEIASNPGETFEVEIIPLKVRALAKGLGARSFVLELLPVDTPIQAGDLISLLGAQGSRYSLLFGQVSDLKRSNSSAFREGGGTLLADPTVVREIFFLEARQAP